jgi:hypothetical protein
MLLVEGIALDREQTGMEENVTAVGAEPGRFGRYLFSLSIFLLAMYCFPLYMVRRADFDARSNSPYSLPLNYAYKMAGQNADVVLFGDSTLLHGVDPSRMSEELGLKAINLPNTGATLRVMDDLSLRRYLEVNRAPRLIVFYFAPWDMDYMHTELPIGTYEGREVLAHQGTAAEIFAYVRRHPLDSLQFPFQFYLANSSLMTILKRPYAYAGVEVARTQGHLSNPASNELSAGCEFWAPSVKDLRFDSVKSLGAKYGSPQTQILYFIAPVPGCRNAAAVVNRLYSELPATPPRELATGMFRGSAMYLHPSAAAVPVVTDQLVEAVRPLLEPAKDR